MNDGIEHLKSIKSFPSLVKYLRDELDWPVDSDDFEDLTYDYVDPSRIAGNGQRAYKETEMIDISILDLFRVESARQRQEERAQPGWVGG
jgi:hypothetical protein